MSFSEIRDIATLLPSLMAAELKEVKNASEKEKAALDAIQKEVNSLCQEVLNLVPKNGEQVNLKPVDQLQILILNAKIEQAQKFFSSLLEKNTPT